MAASSGWVREGQEAESSHRELQVSIEKPSGDGVSLETLKAGLQ